MSTIDSVQDLGKDLGAVGGKTAGHIDKTRRQAMLRQGSVSLRLKIFAALLMMLNFAPTQGVNGHEPIFGVGPRTIYEGGLGVGIHSEFGKEGPEDEFELEEHVIYGITEDWSLIQETPYVYVDEDGHSSEGIGDTVVLNKYRFYHHDIPGGTYQASVIGGLKIPTGDDDAEPPLGTGSWDPILGLAADYEGRRWLTFAAGRFKFNTEHDDFRQGDQFFYDLALGYRPWLTEYTEPDTVLMAELNGKIQGHAELDGNDVHDSGGDVLYAGFGVWWTYRNVAVKPGIQVPVYQDLNGDQHELDYRAVLAFEVHF